MKNKNLIDENVSYVLVSNHQSLLDIIASILSCKNTFRFLAKAELVKVPLLGYVIKRLYIPVERKDKHARSKSIDNLKKSLNEGVSVFIYPEGTRNRTTRPLLDFYDGAFRLAIDNQTPIGVLTILDSRKIHSPLRFFDLNPGVIHCVWDAPVSTVGLMQKDLPALKEKVRGLMLKNLPANL